jgi:hypothetical protein
MTGRIPLVALADRHPGLTKAIGEGYCEAAAVCFGRHHPSPSDVVLDCDGASSTCSAEWVAPDERTKAAWANDIDATEAGAYGVSLAAIELVKGLVAVRRAETLTGADYYVAPVGATADDLEACVRLEVSGTDKGNRAVIRQRLEAKLGQAAHGASNLPAIAAVVGFRELAVVIAKLDGAS